MTMSNLTSQPYARQLEIWRDIKDFEGIYQISNLGRVRRTNTGKIRKNQKTRNGYLLLSLCKNGKTDFRYLHRLVATAFLVKPPNSQYEVNHKNKIKTDNRVDNLEWVTKSENILHSFLMGQVSVKGQECGRSKLTWEQVHEIRKLAKEGVSRTDLAKMFSVAPTTIRSILKNLTWIDPNYSYTETKIGRSVSIRGDS